MTENSNPAASSHTSVSANILTQIRERLTRFNECAEDGEDVDIGRNWLDTLTTLGLLRRGRTRRIAWYMTDAGHTLLDGEASEERTTGQIGVEK